MSDLGKIGVGVVTMNRPHLLQKCLVSLEDNPAISELVVVNDGEDLKGKIRGDIRYILNETNQGVAKSKNTGLRFLQELGCDHFFLIEDDIFVRKPGVFEKYITASRESGIQHFNFSQHGNANKNPTGSRPNPLQTVGYETSQVTGYPHCVGAFSYYSKLCLDKVGLMDERYYNACEHVDHTYEIILEGLHPPFWWFADIADSWEYLGDEAWSIERSTICSTSDFRQNVVNSDEIFKAKHSCYPTEIPHSTWGKTAFILAQLRKLHGTSQPVPANV